MIVRPVGGYGLPHCLRITVGTEEEVHRVIEALRSVRATVSMAEPLFKRLALIGIGLIGSSVARIARERGDMAAEAGGHRADPEDAGPGEGAWLRRPDRARSAAGGARARTA